MVNKTEYDIALLRKGVDNADIASMLDIHISTLYRKLGNRSDFTCCEIQLIRRALQLSDKEVIDIFFGNQLT